MKFIPNSSIKHEMLTELGYKHINDLFTDIPKQIQITDLDLPIDKTQQQVEHQLKNLSNKNKSFDQLPSFLAGGIKPHYIPAVVKSLSSRSEFSTSYTPYQSEASQGFLQAMFEYQSLICEITGMDIANASLYDGATALGEAALMSKRITKKSTFILPTNISLDKRCVLHNYTKGAGMNIKEIPYDIHTGILDPKTLEKHIDNNTAALYLETPNFFGLFEENITKIKQLATQNQFLLIIGINPLTLGIIKSPKSLGADIVIGEGRALGNSMDFGGSGLGLFACKKEYLRQVPGRIIGLTKDTNQHRAFCMTMQTREQHIRRGRATSNICTNEGLNALNALIFLSSIGQNGLYNLGKKNLHQAHQLATQIWELPQYKQVFKATHFNEFVVQGSNAQRIHRHLLQNNIHGGILLEKQYPQLKNCILFGITEQHTSEHIDHLLSTLQEVN
jgi:glycine dehydrogenase subunit 1